MAGCATTMGPPVSPSEYQMARSVLEGKAQRFRYAQLARVTSVGIRLLQALPLDVQAQATPTPYTGLLVAPLEWELGRAYGIPGEFIGGQGHERRVVLIAAVVPGGPAARAGVKPGDLLRSVNDFPVRTPSEAIESLRRLAPGSTVSLGLEREGAPVQVSLVVDRRPYPVRFKLVADGPQADSWNAWAAQGEINVTSRLLAFMHSDDELAVVMGHELAHLVRGHLAKGLGTSLLGAVVAEAVGQATGVGDLGNLAGGVVDSGFSRDFEREADYVGLQFMYRAGYDIRVAPLLWERVATEMPRGVAIPWLASHPSDPERMVRLQREVDELMAQPASSATPAPRPPRRG